MRDARSSGGKREGVTTLLKDVKCLFLDTAPLIYYVEKHPQYQRILKTVFNRIDKGLITAFTSPVTLAECLIHPYRLGLVDLQKDSVDLIVNGRNTVFVPVDDAISQKAAQFRAFYNLSLIDAFQVATAISAGCDTFLTNDLSMKKVTETKVLVLASIGRK
jgi:predicted nucleic acid-binding protein